MCDARRDPFSSPDDRSSARCCRRIGDRSPRAERRRDLVRPRRKFSAFARAVVRENWVTLSRSVTLVLRNRSHATIEDSRAFDGSRTVECSRSVDVASRAVTLWYFGASIDTLRSRRVSIIDVYAARDWERLGVAGARLRRSRAGPENLSNAPRGEVSSAFITARRSIDTLSPTWRSERTIRRAARF